MLTVAEEFLLMTASDLGDEVTAPVIDLPKSRMGIEAALTGAVLMELALRDRIETDLERLWVVNPSPTGEPSADPLLAALVALPAAAPPGCGITDILLKFRESGVYDLAIRSLKARGVVREKTTRILWVIPLRESVIADIEIQRNIRNRVCEVLFNGAFPEPRDICLLGLLEATKKFRRVVPAERLQEAIDQTRRYVDLDLVGRSLSTHVARMCESLSRFGDII